MASTLTKLLVHITFSTKDRAARIPESIEPDLYAYIGGICRNTGSALLTMGGTADHVHLLVSLAKTIALSDLMLTLKRDSSIWLSEHDPSQKWTGWQDGYFAFSIGESGVEALRSYIAKQKDHHRHVTFQDEVRALLRKYSIEWDDRYAWD
ncbi:MAG TPA: IS200/IS605 family transposase [Phycisphaerales bacterium]|nr:IS200/IS605 family transposase [Phycisphaerales bacterium]